MPVEKFGQLGLSEDLDRAGPRHPDREDPEDRLLTPTDMPVDQEEFPLSEPLQELEDEKRNQAEADKLLRQIEEEMAEKANDAADPRTFEEKYWDKVFPPTSDPETSQRRLAEIQQTINQRPSSGNSEKKQTTEAPFSRRKKKPDWPDVKSRQYKDND